MSANSPFDRDRAVWAAQCVAAFALALLAGVGHATCLSNSDPRLNEYEVLLRSNPAAIEARVEQELTSAAAQESIYRASLYHVLAQSYSILEQHNDLRAAASAAFALLPDNTHPVYVDLMYLDAVRPLEEKEVAAALTRAEATLKAQPQDSPAQACALITLGVLEHVSDRPDLASMYLTRAYRMSAGPERRQQRMVAAGDLSIVLEGLRDVPAALALIREVIEWHRSRASMIELSAAYFIEGFLLTELPDRAGARNALQRSRTISVDLKDTVGVAYTDLNLCLNEIGLRNTLDARTYCNAAQRSFADAQMNEPRKQALTGLAEIELMEGNARQALGLLDVVLDQEGRDLPPFRLAHIYELRGKARRDLGLYRDALDDYENFMQRFKANKEDERAREATAMRARFETDREIERNEFLQRELQIKSERLAAQSARLHWMLAAAIASVGVIVLLSFLLVANRKKKRLLVRLAQEDELTGLPNRRYTLKRATETFDKLRKRGAPFTIGILDLDHFKRINDRFGHAAGDFVLKEFARIGRESIRGGDLLGRWGGEEFLILLPDTPLDVALTVVERVRAAASQIAGGPLPDDFNVTLSAGLATNETPGANLEEIITHADVALYDAKNRGRNMVLVAQESYDASPVDVRRSLKQAGIELATGKFSLAS